VWKCHSHRLWYATAGAQFAVVVADRWLSLNGVGLKLICFTNPLSPPTARFPPDRLPKCISVSYHRCHQPLGFREGGKRLANVGMTDAWSKFSRFCVGAMTTVLCGTTRKKTSPDYRNHKTSLHLSSQIPFSPVRIHFSNSSTGSPLNTELISKYPTSLSVLFIPLSLLTYSLPCMLIIPLAPSGCPTPICSTFHLSALHSEPAASVSQALKCGTLFLQFVFRSDTCPGTFRRHLKTHLFQLAFQSLSYFLLMPQI